MKIASLTEIVKDQISDYYVLRITRNLINSNNGLGDFNKAIRDNVKNQIGIYIWENHDNNEILYIGMAGKVKNNGEFVNHSVRQRLLASRGKDEKGIDIQTNKYVQNIILENAISQVNFHVYHLKENQIPGFIEAVLINAYFQKNKCLPKYNSSF